MSSANSTIIKISFKVFRQRKCQHLKLSDGIYVYWRDGFYVTVNYSSEVYKMNISETGKILIGEQY